MRSLAPWFGLGMAYILLKGYPGGWPQILYVVAAVCCLILGVLIWVGGKRSEDKKVSNRHGLRTVDLSLIGAIILVLEIALLALFAYSPPVLESFAEGIGRRPVPKVIDDSESTGADHRADGTGRKLWVGERERPLPQRINHRPGNRPEVFIRLSGNIKKLLEDRIYVQALALGRYKDGVWSAEKSAEELIRAGNDGWLRIEDPSVGDAVECHVYQGKLDYDQNPLIGMQGLVAARTPEVTRFASGVYVLPLTEKSGYDYETISYPKIIDDYLEHEMAVPEVAGDVYLELPQGELGDRISTLTDAVKGEGNRGQQLIAVRDHLRREFKYSLVIDNLNNLDPLENFLFDEKRGHCEVFATAGAMMARAVGVPSRICYGWSGGLYYEGSKLMEFKSRDAHAWAEVWIDEVGWVVFDPTPPSALFDGRADLADADEEAPDPELAEWEDEILLDEEKKWPAWLAWGSMALVPLIFIWRIRRPERSHASTTEKVEMQRVSYRRYVIAGCRRRGVSISQGTTLKSMLEALETPPDFLRELIAYHYAVCFEGKDRDSSLERRMGRMAKAWSERT